MSFILGGKRRPVGQILQHYKGNVFFLTYGGNLDLPGIKLLKSLLCRLFVLNKHDIKQS